MNSYSEKHCFMCQEKLDTTRNPLKETVGGNHLHKKCAESVAWLEPYTPGKLVPEFKKKSRKVTK